MIKVHQIPKEQANDLIRAGHYSKSVVWSSCIHFGVFWEGECIGALQFGPAMNPNSGTKIVRDCRPNEWLELNRMWLADTKPKNCATQAISRAVRELRKLRPELTWIQSFADSRCLKAGGVYQAASFLYCGSHESTFYLLDGKWYHKSAKNRKLIDKRGWTCGPKIAYFVENQHRAEAHTFTQYRYVKFLDPRAQKRLLLPVLPYPKPGYSLD